MIELEAMENGNSKFKPLLSQSETIMKKNKMKMKQKFRL